MTEWDLLSHDLFVLLLCKYIWDTSMSFYHLTLFAIWLSYYWNKKLFLTQIFWDICKYIRREAQRHEVDGSDAGWNFSTFLVGILQTASEMYTNFDRIPVGKTAGFACLPLLMYFRFSKQLDHLRPKFDVYCLHKLYPIYFLDCDDCFTKFKISNQLEKGYMMIKQGS